ncbi:MULTISPECIES: efflux RND transporter permease subunit [Thiorhodovibrio]|uniref:efflux RND transporter permease subunit n=1 Tax=Thiorhodovibrio TaxID=61593 RepID=UPI001912E5D8|nr:MULTISPECIES: efflux RND transporter permease subunit [Thiorhodovibrio]MBK5969008.1 multidrug transporter AcrB [Thiorhodovibrio winogradskyi]WPL15112.1 Multidrug-efflux transporter MexB [Thiorhodovibrio litoralis]
MMLSDLSIRRPVLATVMSLLLVAFGLVSFDRLPLREYPDIDPPVVSIDTVYPGASANVVETRITQLIEDRIAGVEGIESIASSSEDGRSRITIEFGIGRDIDGAANDIRDRVSGVLDQLPVEAEPPDIQKVDSNDDVIMWLNLVSDRMTVPELSDYARRYMVDRFSVLDGVARVRVGGQQTYAMRVWLDRNALAARELTVADVESALRAENVELPAGSVESLDRQFSVRTERNFRTPEEFARLVVDRGEDGYLVRLGDVARVELGTEENRTVFRGNGVPMVGLGIIKQSTANTVSVADRAKAEMARLNPTLPEGMELKQSYDTSVFIKDAIKEVYKTLAIAILLVVTVIFLFLGSARAMLVPAVTVPVSLIATFSVLLALDFSVNILTLLALVLAIGLVVDDAIVVLENIHRRMETLGESRLVAAFRGTRQVGFAVIATTVVLLAVFVPIVFLRGDIGRLFSEFALTMSAAVVFSTFVALSLSPMLASLILPQSHGSDDGKPRRARLSAGVDWLFDRVRVGYAKLLEFFLRQKWIIALLFLVTIGLAWWMLTHIPQEYSPKEDRGAFFVLVNGPEGATFSYMEEYMDEIERRLLPYAESGEAIRVLMRAPRGHGGGEAFNNGIVILVMNSFDKRRSSWVIIDEVRAKLADLPGVRAFPVMRSGFGTRIQKPVQFVIGGGTYEELAEWRDILVEKIEESNPGLVGVDWDYKETKPQLSVEIDYDRAADLGIRIDTIGRTLETMLGSRKVTTYIDAGEEYDLILEGERDTQRTPGSLENLYVRSARSGHLVPLSNLVKVTETADSNELNRYNRVRAITIEANLADDLSLGDALSYLDGLVADNLPEQVVVDYKGQSADFRESGSGILFVFLLGVAVVYLVLAAQFESWVHPLVIMLTVPLAMAGALLGLWVTGQTLNIYSQIGLIMLVGLSAKNGILIVEFANQLRDQGQAFREALTEAAAVRLRPIVMTGITTAAGSIPLLLSSGAGAETRAVIGTVILFGVVAATLFTLFVVPVAYDLLARGTGSPGERERRLEQELAQTPG